MTTENVTPKFDLEAVYDKEIAPLIKQIIIICKRAGIPMLASFNYAVGVDDDDPSRIRYCTTLLDDGKGFVPDELKEAIRIIRNGASTRPKLMALTITKQ